MPNDCQFICIGEEDTKPTSVGDCCDVCKTHTNISDHKQKLKVLIDALDVIGSKGEVKVSELICGSNTCISWTDSTMKKQCHMVIIAENILISGDSLLNNVM